MAKCLLTGFRLLILSPPKQGAVQSQNLRTPLSKNRFLRAFLSAFLSGCRHVNNYILAALKARVKELCRSHIPPSSPLSFLFYFLTNAVTLFNHLGPPIALEQSPRGASIKSTLYIEHRCPIAEHRISQVVRCECIRSMFEPTHSFINQRKK